MGLRPGSRLPENDQFGHEADQHHGVGADRPLEDPEAPADLGKDAIGLGKGDGCAGEAQQVRRPATPTTKRRELEGSARVPLGPRSGGS